MDIFTRATWAATMASGVLKVLRKTRFWNWLSKTLES